MWIQLRGYGGICDQFFGTKKGPQLERFGRSLDGLKAFFLLHFAALRSEFFASRNQGNGEIRNPNNYTSLATR